MNDPALDSSNLSDTIYMSILKKEYEDEISNKANPRGSDQCDLCPWGSFYFGF